MIHSHLYLNLCNPRASILGWNCGPVACSLFSTFLLAKFKGTWEQGSVQRGGCRHFTYFNVSSHTQLNYWINFVSISNLQSEKLALMESMRQELEEKIRKLEEDKQNMDISAGKIFVLFCVSTWVWQKCSDMYVLILCC